jgi:stage III sporulation protein AH
MEMGGIRMHVITKRSILWFLLFLVMILSIVFGTIKKIDFHALWGGEQDTIVEDAKTGSDEQEVVPVIGETVVVAPISGDGKNFFVEYRIDRDRIRSQQIELLQAVVDNDNSDEGSRKEAYDKLIEISQNLEKEMEIEHMIKAKGFAEAIVFINNDAASVIVETSALDPQTAAQIGEIIIKNTNIKPERISIIPKE